MAFIDLFAWFVLIVLALTAVVIFVALGMAPGYYARKRNHPWSSAVKVAGWVS